VGVTGTELEIIDSAPFQRLRLLKQLSHAYLLYPSAMHVRFEHSLGAMYVADRMCTSLSVPDRERELARLVVLCHDLGHGPFSHLFEKPLQTLNGDDFSHEVITSWILKDKSAISDALNEFAYDVQTLLPVYRGKTEYRLLREIVSSGLDADKLDYLRRDSYHVGVAYGSFDLDRILHTLSSTPEGNLCVLEKGKDAVENYRLGRYLMHAQVYEHHTRLATDGMFLRAFELAIRDGTIDKDLLRVGTRKNSYNSANHSNFLKYYLKLNDETITRQLQEAGGNAKKLIADLSSRKLLKSAIELNTDLDVFDALKKKKISELEKSDMTKLEKEVAKEVGCDPDLVIAHLQQMTIKLYDRYDILVKRRDDSILTLEDVSPISASVKPIVKLFIFCPEQFRDKIRSATYDYFSLTPANSTTR
jgi:HD superfamily phosphohydrolase